MILAKLILLPLTLSLAVSALRADVDYQGEIDIYTGEPVYSEEAAEHRSLMISDDCYYDTTERLFRFSVPDSSEYVYSNVADGMITNQAVTLRPDGGVAASLYKDGNKVEQADLTQISGIGSYTLVVSTSAEVDYQLFSFTIASGYTSGISSYVMPSGFELTGVVLSGESQPLWSKDQIDFAQDGEYNISYRCKATNIEYGLRLVMDNVPPELTITGLKDGTARNPVTISGLKEGDRISITCDGEKMDYPSDGILTMPGSYVVTASDSAGNTVTQSFRIRIYLNAQAVWFTVIMIAVIAAAIIYMYMARKKLRVR